MGQIIYLNDLILFNGCDQPSNCELWKWKAQDPTEEEIIDEEIVVGLEEEINLTVYPNPVSDVFMHKW